MNCTFEGQALLKGALVAVWLASGPFTMPRALAQHPFGAVTGHSTGAIAATTAKPACKPSASKLGVSRTIVIDGADGKNFGTVNYRNNKILNDKEVILTFDDGPLARNTNKVLDALARECTRATFFFVGRMAIAFPGTVRRAGKEGHTIAGHTWSHANFQRRSSASGAAEFERGMAAVAAALGRPIAPIFRFPYLARTRNAERHMAKRKTAVFSIDIDSLDTRRGNGRRRIISSTIAQLKRRGRGILLFHDIKSTTAAAIPEVLRQLRKNGFKIVHVTTRKLFVPDPKYHLRYTKLIEKRNAKARRRKLAARGPAKTPALPVRRRTNQLRESGDSGTTNAANLHSLRN